MGEYDDDEIEDYPPRFQPERPTNVVDVEIVDDDYTDAIMSDHAGVITPDESHDSLSDPLSPGVGPLGMGGPAGSGLMSLQDAVEAAADMRARAAAQAARTRDMRLR